MMHIASRFAGHIFTVLMVVLIAVSMLMLLLVISDQSPPVTLIDTSYVLGEFCPGDTVAYTVTWRVNRPANLELIESHFLSGSSAIITSRHKEYIPVHFTGQLLRSESWTVPNFKPGRYEWVLGISANSEARLPAFLVQPYTIREDCEQ